MMSVRTYFQVLDDTAADIISDKLDLMPRISARLERKSLMTTMRARPVVTVIVVLLALLILTTVVYALGRLTGYIPGVGFVQKDSLRVLVEPVSQTRDGITVSIEQVVADSERTIVIYKTEGLSLQAANSEGEGGGNPFGSVQQLRLPDGTTFQELAGDNNTPEPILNNIKTEGGWPNYVRRLVYPPISSDVNELTLLIPVLQNMPVGAAAENWSLTFQLKPAPADVTYAPIIEITPASQNVTTPSPVAGEINPPALLNTATSNGFTLQLDNVIELQDGYIFTGNLSWNDSVFPTGNGMISEAVIPVLKDANGQVIPVEQVPLDWASQEHKTLWSFRTNRKAFMGPLTLSIPSIKTTLNPPAVDFDIDLGSNPQVGQIWERNQDFVFAGQTIHLSSVQLNGNCGVQMYDLTFTFTSGLAGIYAYVNDLAPQTPFDYSCEGGGAAWENGNPVDSKTFYAAARYRNIPTGLHQYSMMASIPHEVNGPWQVTWTPLLTSESTPTPAAGACLTLDTWNQLSARNDPLPSGLGGKIVTTIDEGGNLPAIYVSNLDGTNSSKIDIGSWTSLSMDGTRLAYSGTDANYVLNLSSGEKTTVGIDGYHVVLSPDNTRAMYTTTFGLYVVNADGTGLQKIDTGSTQVISVVGWLPDNQTIVYAAMGGEGFTFITHNLQSGEARELFSFQNKAGFGTISSDGQWITFADRIFGATGWGIFISRLDGSERRLIVEPEVPTNYASVWSPDGQWLIINTLDANGKEIPVLVNPFACQIMPLNNVNGTIEDWSP